MKSWRDFLLETYELAEEELNIFANNLINMSSLKNDDIIVDAGAGVGLISANILKHKKYNVIAVDKDSSCLSELNKLAEIHGNLKVQNNDLAHIQLQSNSVDKILERSSLMHCKDKLEVLKEYYRILKSNSQMSLFEVVFYDKLDRYYEYLPSKIKNLIFYKSVEEKVRNDMDDPLTNFDEYSIENLLKEVGFKNINIVKIPEVVYFKINDNIADSNIFYDDKPHTYSLKEKFLKYMTEEQFEIYYNELEKNMKYKTVHHNAISLYIFAQKDPNLYDYIRLKLKVLWFKLFKILPLNLKNMIVNPFIKLKYDIKCWSQKFIEITLVSNPDR